MIKKFIFVSLGALSFLSSIKAQPLLDSTYRRLSFNAGAEMAFPGNKYQVPGWLRPDFGFDMSTGRHFRMGVGLYYFSRPVVNSGLDNLTGTTNSRLLNIQAMEVPLSIGITLAKFRKATLNLNTSFALGHSITPGNIYRTSEAKAGIAVDMDLPEGKYLEIAPYAYYWQVMDNNIHASPGIGLNVKFGWLYYKPVRKRRIWRMLITPRF